MTIQRKPKAATKPSTLDPADFLRGAPDAEKASSAPVAPFAGRMQGNQAQITLAMPSDLLDKAGAAAKKLAISRAAFIKQAISRAVDAEAK